MGFQGRHFSLLHTHGTHRLRLQAGVDIDLHVNDLEGVGLEGAEHGFKVVVVSVADEKWTQRVLEAARQLPTS